MLHTLCTLLCALLLTPAMQSGELLRLHVIPADDTAPMQSLKYAVRDALHAQYAALADGDAPQLAAAAALLPQLTRAAQDCARSHGFTGPVMVSLAMADFGDRTLGHLTVPAGTYPALIIRLGDAKGANWWGLIDPELSLRLSAIDPKDAQDGFTWSLRSLWTALTNRFRPIIHLQEVNADAP